MVDYSIFKHEWTKSQFACDVPISKDYKVYLNGKEIPVYTCRISAYPFNTWWPGHQRPVDQSEVVSFINLVSDESFTLEVEPLTKTAYERVMLKPYSKGVKVEKENGRLKFTLKENGGYMLELDDYHGLLYIFNNKPVICENPANYTYYYGAGVHFPGKITLKSGESVYADKDALIYGCIYAENAENITIRGNGIFDDSGEERFSEHCYEPYANGNIKFYDCKNVRIEGVGFTNSAIWCVNLFHCFDVQIDGIKVFGQWRYNTDGFDIVNCQRIVMKNSFIHSFDDSITIKGIDRYAYESNTDMLFEHCVLSCDWGKTLEIGLETAAREYKNIVFRDIDVLRGGDCTCDIHNGDYAEVHNITFENIRIEMESFYTTPILQEYDEQEYNGYDGTEISYVFKVMNDSFRDMDFYAGLNILDAAGAIEKGDKCYSGVHDILVKDIFVYADEKLISENKKRCTSIYIENFIPSTEYKNLKVENVYLNGQRVQKKDMDIYLKGCDDSALIIL